MTTKAWDSVPPFMLSRSRLERISQSPPTHSISTGSTPLQARSRDPTSDDQINSCPNIRQITRYGHPKKIEPEYCCTGASNQFHRINWKGKLNIISFMIHTIFIHSCYSGRQAIEESRSQCYIRSITETDKKVMHKDNLR